MSLCKFCTPVCNVACSPCQPNYSGSNANDLSALEARLAALEALVAKGITFTEEERAALDSGITADLVAKIGLGGGMFNLSVTPQVVGKDTTDGDRAIYAQYFTGTTGTSKINTQVTQNLGPTDVRKVIGWIGQGQYKDGSSYQELNQAYNSTGSAGAPTMFHWFQIRKPNGGGSDITMSAITNNPNMLDMYYRITVFYTREN